MMDTIEITDAAKITEPAKQWRNRWKAKISFVYKPAACHFNQGDVFMGDIVHPSKDVAEQKALDLIAGHPEVTEYYCEYLGAFPT